jgi:hypothetical protein
MIPKIIHRTIPHKTNAVIDACWDSVKEFCPDYTLMTHYDEDDFPISKPHFDKCPSGAFRADLIRLEVVYKHGGIFLDSDIQLIKSLDPLLEFDMWNALEHQYYMGNIAFGAVPEHPAIKATLDFAIDNLSRLEQGTTITNSYYSSVAWGPWVHTEAMKNRRDVKHLSVDAFMPFYLNQPLSAELQEQFPLWKPTKDSSASVKTQLSEKTYGVHLFNWSWVKDKNWEKR